MSNGNITANNQPAQGSTATFKPLSELQEYNSVYFGYFDYHVIDINKQLADYSGIPIEKFYLAMEERLKIALLFFDKVILHFSDPMRDEDVLKILESYQWFLKEGRIVFLYSTSIKQIDYDSILDYAKLKKGEGEHGLDAFIDKRVFADKVVALLQMSKVNYHRNVSKNNTSRQQFFDLVKGDIGEDEMTQDEYKKRAKQVERDKYNLGNIGLSLRDLIYRKYSVKGKPEYTKAIADEIFNRICERAVAQYSRQHIRNDCEEILKKHFKDDSFLKLFLTGVDIRLCYLYAKLNSGDNHMMAIFPKDEFYSYLKPTTFNEYLTSTVTNSGVDKLCPSVLERLFTEKKDILQLYIKNYLINYSSWVATKSFEGQGKIKAHWKNGHSYIGSELDSILGGK